MKDLLINPENTGFYWELKHPDDVIPTYWRAAKFMGTSISEVRKLHREGKVLAELGPSKILLFNKQSVIDYMRKNKLRKKSQLSKSELKPKALVNLMHLVYSILKL